MRKKCGRLISTTIFRTTHIVNEIILFLKQRNIIVWRVSRDFTHAVDSHCLQIVKFINLHGLFWYCKNSLHENEYYQFKSCRHTTHFRFTFLRSSIFFSIVVLAKLKLVQVHQLRMMRAHENEAANHHRVFTNMKFPRRSRITCDLLILEIISSLI